MSGRLVAGPASDAGKAGYWAQGTLRSRGPDRATCVPVLPPGSAS